MYIGMLHSLTALKGRCQLRAYMQPHNWMPGTIRTQVLRLWLRVKGSVITDVSNSAVTGSLITDVSKGAVTGSMITDVSEGAVSWGL